jgi:poly(3-hydroxybutyrate) depolymerase
MRNLPVSKSWSASRARPLALALLAAAFAAALVTPLRAASSIGMGKGSFQFEQAGKHVTVWYYVPPSAAQTAPIVFVMHGTERNGDTYRNDWLGYAERQPFILLCPTFSKAEFPGDAGYIFGNAVDLQGRPRPPAEWAFNMIEPIFDAVRTHLGNASTTYALYGHSAGAQFVHRFLYFVPQARASQVISANAGWYTLPDPEIPFPYGLKGSPVAVNDLKAALQRPLVIFLGSADVDLKNHSLRVTPEAEAQGPNRWTRGHYFLKRGQAEAGTLGVTLGWRIAVAPDIGHSDPGMSLFAIKELFPTPAQP